MKTVKKLVIMVLVLGLTAEVAKADFTFGTPTNIGPPISTPYGEFAPCITAVGLEMYISYYNRPGYAGWSIWISTRDTVNDDWGAPVNLGSPVDTGLDNAISYISSDGLELYFEAYNRSGGYGNWDLWVTTRATRDDAWGIPENLGPTVNSSAWDVCPHISSDGLELYFGSRRSGGYGSDDIWVSRRATKNDPWEQPTNLGPVVNSSASETGPFLSSDGLLLFFSENRNAPIRPGGSGNQDMWVTRRASISDPWGAPLNLGPAVNSPSLDSMPQISRDGSTLYFSSDRPGGLGGPWGDIYQAPIIPIVDFNTDGIVDAADICIMVDHWGEDYSLCDIGPTPFGDGLVDIEDLKALAEYIGKPVDDPTLVGHWAMDETEGMVAQDHAGTNNGTVLGLPQWRPDDGTIDGALELDGTTFVTAKSVLDPANGPFSVLAWVKGGAPGQVIVAQQGSADWLMADAATGILGTELSKGGRTASGLLSQTIITDNTWHRIAFTWDGTNRRLYMDSVLIAEDTQDSLAASAGNVILGAAQNMAPGTYWTGLIDDVRIYNRAVRP